MPQLRRAGHQGNMRFPEFAGFGGPFGQLGCSNSEVIPRERPVAKRVKEAVPELVAQCNYTLVRRAAVRAGVASIFDERDFGFRRSEKMIFASVEGRIEPLTLNDRHYASLLS